MIHLGTNIKFGLDVELFLIEDGRIVSAHEILPFKKHALRTRKSTLHADGVVAEITTINPRTCRMFILDDLHEGLQNLSKILRNFNKDNKRNIQLHIVPAAEIEEDYFSNLPKEAKELGCEPELNAYVEDGKEEISNVTDGRWRFAGGHIHFSCKSYWDGMAEVNHALLGEGTVNTVKILDLVVGNYCIFLEDFPELSSRRREVYGKPGAFRKKDYGIEYRALSNLYLLHPAKYQLILGLMREAISMACNPELVDSLLTIPSIDTVKAMLYNDKELAVKNLNEVSTVLRRKGFGLMEEEALHVNLQPPELISNSWSAVWNIEGNPSSHGSGLRHQIHTVYKANKIN